MKKIIGMIARCITFWIMMFFAVLAIVAYCIFDVANNIGKKKQKKI